MKKLTAKEINDFKPSYYNQMKVEHHDRDIMDDYSTLREITILSPVMMNDECIIFDNIGNVRTLHLKILESYKSLLKPVWTFEKITKHPEIKFGTFCYNSMNMKALVLENTVINDGIKTRYYFSIYAEGDDALSTYTSSNFKDIELIKNFRFFRQDNSEIFPRED